MCRSATSIIKHYSNMSVIVMWQAHSNTHVIVVVLFYRVAVFLQILQCCSFLALCADCYGGGSAEYSVCALLLFFLLQLCGLYVEFTLVRETSKTWKCEGLCTKLKKYPYVRGMLGRIWYQRIVRINFISDARPVFRCINWLFHYGSNVSTLLFWSAFI